MNNKWIPALSVLLGVQLALAVALDLRADRLTPARPDTHLVKADLKAVDHLRLDGPVTPDPAASGVAPVQGVELVKRDGQWTLPNHYNAPADTTRIETLLERLGTLRRGLPIATTNEARDRFAVSDKHYERRLVAGSGGKPITTVYLGASSGPHKSDARSADDAAVYAVELASYELPTGADEWLDNAMLGHEAGAPTEIDVALADKPQLALKKAGAGWQADGLPAGRSVSATQADALAAAMAGVKVDAVLGEQALPAWQQDKPELTLTMKDKQGKTVTWTLSKTTKGDFHVLKSSDKPWYLKLETFHARPLLDAAAPDKLVVAAAPAAAAPAASGATPHDTAGGARHARR
jgi:Domain of unknown function (DUF4340)